MDPGYGCTTIFAKLYYAGIFDHGTPTGSWWWKTSVKLGTALTHLVHREDPTQWHGRHSLHRGWHEIAAQGGYLRRVMKGLKSLKLQGEAVESRPATPVRHGAWSLFSNKGNLTDKTSFTTTKAKKTASKRQIPAQRRRL